MRRGLVWLAIPVVTAVAVVAALLAIDPFATRDSVVPPIEQLTVERVALDDQGILATIRAEGSAPLRIAQVMVDGAFWTFTQDPPGAVARLGSADIRIPYPWVAGEAHKLTFVAANGATFEHAIDVAVATPRASTDSIGSYLLLGAAVGFLPVSLGMLFYPALRAGGEAAFSFALALTLGLLGFLFVDTLGEALSLAAKASPGLHTTTLVWLVLPAVVLLLLALARRGAKQMPEGAALAGFIALGIGLHNFGEGLAIGTAFATGAAALGTYLVLGFTIHNITEGIGIVAPVLERRPHVSVFVGLAALAGLPAVPGVWLGQSIVASHWAAVALAIGAGAILQVTIEIALLFVRRARDARFAPQRAYALLGAVTGIGVMYGTALLVQSA